MSRLRSNFQRGSLSANAGSGDTSLSSGQFSALPVVASPDYLMIVLDPDAAHGNPEIVRVTAHTSSSTTVTVVRAQESTSARSHNSSTTWRHVPTAKDWSIVRGGIFQVTEFLAECDGTTVDTTAVQNALTAASSAGGTVVFPAGTTTLVDAQLQVTGSNVTILLPASSTLKLKTGSNSNLIRVNTTGDNTGATRLSNFAIQGGGTLDHNGANQNEPGAGIVGAVAVFAVDGHSYDVSIINAKSCALNAQSCTRANSTKLHARTPVLGPSNLNVINLGGSTQATYNATTDGHVTGDSVLSGISITGVADTWTGYLLWVGGTGGERITVVAPVVRGGALTTGGVILEGGTIPSADVQVLGVDVEGVGNGVGIGCINTSSKPVVYENRTGFTGGTVRNCATAGSFDGGQGQCIGVAFSDVNQGFVFGSSLAVDEHDFLLDDFTIEMKVGATGAGLVVEHASTASPLTGVKIGTGIVRGYTRTPPPVVTLVADSTGSQVTAGAHYYAVTCVNGSYESLANRSASVTTDGTHTQVSLTNIPLGPYGTTARKIYRTAAAGTQLKLLATISDNTTRTYSDIIADGSLGANIPTRCGSSTDAGLRVRGYVTQFDVGATTIESFGLDGVFFDALSGTSPSDGQFSRTRIIDNGQSATSGRQYGVNWASAINNVAFDHVRLTDTGVAKQLTGFGGAGAATNISVHYPTTSGLTLMGQLAAGTTVTTVDQTNPVHGPTGALAETFPRSSRCDNVVAMSQGYLQLHAIWIPAGTLISNLVFWAGAQAAVNPTHWWYGLYDSSYVQLATTADQTSAAFSANVKHILPIATTAAGSVSTFTTTYTGWHYLGIMMTSSTTQANLCALSTAGTTAQANISQAAPPLWGNDTTGTGAGSLTTPPAFPYTSGGPNGAVNYAYAYVT